MQSKTDKARESHGVLPCVSLQSRDLQLKYCPSLPQLRDHPRHGGRVAAWQYIAAADECKYIPWPDGKTRCYAKKKKLVETKQDSFDFSTEDNKVKKKEHKIKKVAHNVATSSQAVVTTSFS